MLSSDWTGDIWVRYEPTNQLIEFPTGAATKEAGLDIEALYARNRHWVILGDSGSGKTTLLRHQAPIAGARARGPDRSRRDGSYPALR